MLGKYLYTEAYKFKALTFRLLLNFISIKVTYYNLLILAILIKSLYTK